MKPNLFLKAAKVVFNSECHIDSYCCMALDGASESYPVDEMVFFIDLFKQPNIMGVASASAGSYAINYGWWGAPTEKAQEARVLALLLCYQMTKTP